MVHPARSSSAPRRLRLQTWGSSTYSSASSWNSVERTCREKPITVERYQASRSDGCDRLRATLVNGDDRFDIASEGKGILDAFVTAINARLNTTIVIVDYSEHTLGNNEQSEAIAYVQLSIHGQRSCGAGCSEDIVGASLRAVLNAVSRAGVEFTVDSEPKLAAV